MPVDRSSTPSSSPRIEVAAAGKFARIIAPSRTDTSPETITQPPPLSGRRRSAKTILKAPIRMNNTATITVSDTRPASGLAQSPKPRKMNSAAISSEKMKAPVSRMRAA